MELLKEKLKNRVFQKSQVPKRYDNWWTEQGKEISAYFKTNCYWIAHTFPKNKIYEKFKIAQQEKRNFRYFLGMLRK